MLFLTDSRWLTLSSDNDGAHAEDDGKTAFSEAGGSTAGNLLYITVQYSA